MPSSALPAVGGCWALAPGFDRTSTAVACGAVDVRWAGRYVVGQGASNSRYW